MKALIYKEFKLAMHPICYVFVCLFPFMIFIPSYPIGVGFIYVLSSYPILFLGANKGQQSNDLLYSTLMPVRKKDIVFARIITVLSMQGAYMIIMSALFPAAYLMNKAMTVYDGEITNPGLGFDAYVSLLAIVIVGFALADLIFFPIYYKKGKSIVMSTLLTILGFVVYLSAFTVVFPYVIPGYMDLFSGNLGIQFAFLGAGIAVSALLHFAVYKISSANLEKVDF